jgi:hypothetical protein
MSNVGPGARTTAAVGLGGWLIALALSILGAPRPLGWIALVGGTGLVLTAVLWWAHDRSVLSNSIPPPVGGIGTAIAEYAVARQEAEARARDAREADEREAAAAKAKKALQEKREALLRELDAPRLPRPLSGRERDELRALIDQGSALLVVEMDAERIRAWARTAGAWLTDHRNKRRAADFDASWPRDDSEAMCGFVQRRLVDLRVVLTNNTPAGFALDLTPMRLSGGWRLRTSPMTSASP